MRCNALSEVDYDEFPGCSIAGETEGRGVMITPIGGVHSRRCTGVSPPPINNVCSSTLRDEAVMCEFSRTKLSSFYHFISGQPDYILDLTVVINGVNSNLPFSPFYQRSCAG